MSNYTTKQLQQSIQEWLDTADASAAGLAIEAEVSEAAQFVDAIEALQECTCTPDCVTVCPVCQMYLRQKDELPF